MIIGLIYRTVVTIPLNLTEIIDVIVSLTDVLRHLPYFESPFTIQFAISTHPHLPMGTLPQLLPNSRNFFSFFFPLMELLILNTGG